MVNEGIPVRDSILLGDNLELLAGYADRSFQLIYIDPPFNTGRVQSRKTLAVVRDGDGERRGFAGKRYTSKLLAESSYSDVFADYHAFLEPRLRAAHRLLSTEGTLYFHIDYREAHHCKLLLDEIFGRECFLNELIWAYDYGARTKRRWPAKHDTILVYVKDPNAYHFDSAEVDREPYMAPGLVTPEKAALGKLPTDVWWHTIVPTAGHEKTGSRAAHGPGLDPPRGLVPGLLRRQRHARRRGCSAGTPLCPDRLQPRGRGDHARPSRTARGGKTCEPVSHVPRRDAPVPTQLLQLQHGRR
jgi:hypothetical protein